MFIAIQKNGEIFKADTYDEYKQILETLGADEVLSAYYLVLANGQLSFFPMHL